MLQKNSTPADFILMMISLPMYNLTGSAKVLHDGRVYGARARGGVHRYGGQVHSLSVVHVKVVDHWVALPHRQLIAPANKQKMLNSVFKFMNIERELFYKYRASFFFGVRKSSLKDFNNSDFNSVFFTIAFFLLLFPVTFHISANNYILR